MHSSMHMRPSARSCIQHTRPCSQVAMRTHRRYRSCNYTPATTAAAATEAQTSPQIDDAVFLAWLASRNKSLFAAKCLVETVLQCYQRGYLVDDLQVSLQMKVLQSPTDILGPMDQDVLISWIMLIMSTAQQLGVARTAAGLEAAGATTGAAPAAGPANQDLSDTSMPAAGASSGAGPSQSSGAGQPTAAGTTAAAAAAAADPITQRFSGQVLGLLQYVKNTLNMYQQQEYTLQRLQSLQATVNQEQQRSQFLDLMQQYTRLVLITVEVVAAQQLPTTFPLTNPHTLRSPSGYTASIWPDLLSPAGATPAGSSSSSSASSATAAAGGGSSEAHGPPLSAARACALRLLMAWMGAVLGSSYSRQRFVALALEAYTAGYAAGDLYSQIADEEYSQTGGLIPLPSQPQMVVEVNAQLFGQWLSCCYLTWAQLGVSFPGAADQTGWAWAGGGDAVTANALAAFTAQAIRRLDTERLAAAADPDLEPGAADIAAEMDPLAARIKSNPEAAAGLDAVQAALSQEVLEQGTFRGRPLPPLVKVPDEQLARTSTAIKVWRQLLEVVQEACATATATTPTAND